jgi:class 3 adenylate cyclase
LSQYAALLQTDIVDSTRVSEALGDVAASRLWAEHDRVARDLLQRWEGREIDKSDGFFLLFSDVAVAFEYAREYHRALTVLGTPLRSRAGLHFGPIETRETPAGDVARGAKPLELDGRTKYLTARVMSIALGGQTLLTQSAVESLDDGADRFRSLGYWRLKGVEEPVQIFEDSDADNATMPPDSDKAYSVVRKGSEWLPRRDVPHSLPAEPDQFVGRSVVLREIRSKFDEGGRLVSLLGTGGIGKTRIAQRFGWLALGDRVGGVWFCDLTAATSFDGLLHGVSVGLRLPLSAGDPIEQISMESPGAVLASSFSTTSSKSSIRPSEPSASGCNVALKHASWSLRVRG